MISCDIRSVSIVKHPDPNRAKPWQVSFRDVEKKRKSTFFATEAEAKVYAEQINVELLQFGVRALELPVAVRLDAQQAITLLIPWNTSLLDAVNGYIEQRKRATHSMRIDQLVEKFLWDKQSDGVSAIHLSDLRSRLLRFARDFGGRMANTIDTPEIADWLRDLKISPQTYVNFRRVLHNFFSYAENRGLVERNPTKKIQKMRIPDHAIEIYSPEEIELLLTHAEPIFRPYLAIGAFAGIRRAEILRLDWQTVDFKTGNIKIGGDIAKTRSKRLVPISSNLRAWIEPLAQPSGKILTEHMQGSFIRLLKETRQRSGVIWKKNALRHSYATYRMATTNDVTKTSYEMGNSPSIVFKHYRELVTPDVAEAYWNVRPKEETEEQREAEAA